jgi:hypothetical protein
MPHLPGERNNADPSVTEQHGAKGEARNLGSLRAGFNPSDLAAREAAENPDGRQSAAQQDPDSWRIPAVEPQHLRRLTRSREVMNDG